MKRREALQAVAALAAGRWADEGYDPEQIESWGTPDGLCTTGEFELDGYYPHVAESVLHWDAFHHDFSSSELRVQYSRDDVSLVTLAESDEVEASTLVELDPDQARDIAAALYQAAEEQERRGPQ